MKSTGIIRRLDSLGRLVLPVELRRIFDLKEDDAVEIYVENDVIMLKKYQPECIFCDSASDLKDFKGKMVCSSCMKSIKE